MCDAASESFTTSVITAASPPATDALPMILNFLEDNTFWLVGGVIAVTAITFSAISGTLRSQARERTRREIAAYIAEGSMTPEQGERLMKAGKDDDCC